MSSIRDLKNLLDTKGGTPASLTDEDLQATKSYIDEMMVIRETNSLPSDSGQNRSGTDCTTHSAGSRVNTDLSVGDFNDWQSSNVASLTCTSELYSSAYCGSRTDYICTSRNACACNNRSGACSSRNCDCRVRSYSPCSGRTDCGCNVRCSCNTVDVFS